MKSILGWSIVEQKSLKTLWIVSILIGLATFSILTLFVNVGVDILHDGIMLKPALDWHLGLIPFRDSFNQYGILSTLIQKIFIDWFGPTLLVIRFSALVFYAMTAAGLFILFSSVAGPALSFIAVSFWLLQCHYFQENYLWPWSTIYSIFFQVVSQIFVILCFKPNVNFKNILALSAGVTAAFAGLARTPSALICGLAVGIPFVVQFLVQRERKYFFRFGLTIIGFTAVWLFFFSILFFYHAAQSAWEQLFVFPHAFYLSGPNLSRWSTLISRFFPEPLFVFFLIISFAWGIGTTISISRKRWGYIVCGLMVILYYILVYSNHWLYGVKALAYSIPFFNLLGFCFFIWGKTGPAKNKYSAECVFVLLFGGLMSCLQLYHDSNPSGLFWASILSSFSVVYTIHLCGKKTSIVLTTVVVFSLPCFLIKTKTVWQVLHKPRIKFSPGSPLSGMMESSDRVIHLQKLINKIHSYESEYGPRPILLLGRDALFSALGGKADNPEGIYVEWGTLNLGTWEEGSKKFIDQHYPLIIRQAPGSVQMREYASLVYALNMRGYSLLEEDQHQDYGPYELYGKLRSRN